MQTITKNQTETIKFGKNFAEKLKGGEVVLLIGDLGAGKTTFVKGVAKGLGIKQVVNSPTFVIMKTYQTQSSKSKVQSKLKVQNLKFKKNKSEDNQQLAINNLIHIDTYRGIDIGGLEDVGALEFFGKKDCVCLVEWGEGLEKYLKSRKLVYFQVKIYNLNSNSRKFIVKKYGTRKTPRDS